MSYVTGTVLVLLLSSCELGCISTSTVVSIGGCDKSGSCGVVLANGVRTTVQYPTIGATARYPVECHK